jgi:hypothetical protein
MSTDGSIIYSERSIKGGVMEYKRGLKALGLKVYTIEEVQKFKEMTWSYKLPGYLFCAAPDVIEAINELEAKNKKLEEIARDYYKYWYASRCAGRCDYKPEEADKEFDVILIKALEE